MLENNEIKSSIRNRLQSKHCTLNQWQNYRCNLFVDELWHGDAMGWEMRDDRGSVGSLLTLLRSPWTHEVVVRILHRYRDNLDMMAQFFKVLIEVEYMFI
jgi:hypothetical protein